MTGTQIEVRVAGLADKDVLRHLLEFLAYEHSRFDGADLDGHGSGSDTATSIITGPTTIGIRT